jgi:hypothetical protein
MARYYRARYFNIIAHVGESTFGGFYGGFYDAYDTVNPN